jgi:hypothetical protein
VPVWSRVWNPRPTRLRGRGRRVDGGEAALGWRDLRGVRAAAGSVRDRWIMDFGGVKSAWFKGSEGNLLSIVEFVFIPKGIAHGFTNAGQEPARYLGIVTPGGLHEKPLSSLGESAVPQTPRSVSPQNGAAP